MFIIYTWGAPKFAEIGEVLQYDWMKFGSTDSGLS